MENFGPLFGQYGWLLGLFGVLNVLCLIHAVVTRQGALWIVLLALNLFLGGFIATLFYTFMVLIPSLQGSRRAATQAVQRGVEAIKPLDVRLREAQQALAESDTLANRSEVANLQARAGRPEDAQATLEPLLRGIYADDPVVLLSAARLDLARQNPADAEARLRRVDLRTSTATRTQTLTLLAQAQEQQGKPEADVTYQEASRGATTEEPRARHAAYLLRQGRTDEARTVLAALEKAERQASPLYRKQEREWFQMAAELRRELR